MRALWSDDEAAFDGEHVSFSPSWSWPKPQVPIPVLLGGGAGPRLMAHAVEWADGWIPIGGSGLAEQIPRYRAALEAAGRDPDAARVVPFGSHPSAEKIEHFASIGVSECVFRLPSAPRGEVLEQLEAQAELLQRIL